MTKEYPCPVCRAKVLWREKYSYDICPVCGWEEEGHCQRYPDEPMWGGYSIDSARKAWAEGKTLFERYPNPNAKKD